MIYSNYHTHTKRCHHAVAKDEKYIKAAIKKGIKILGFSDHGPYPYENGYVSNMRMSVAESAEYFESIRALKEKYKNKIEVLIGFEYEYFPQHEEWLKNFLKENRVDYIILGQHHVPYEIGGLYSGNLKTAEDILLYRDFVIKAMNTGMFAYVCHPDLYLAGYRQFDEIAEQVARDICKEALRLDIPLEYNVYGVQKSFKAMREVYPVMDFWKIVKETGNKVIIGVDAHTPRLFTSKKYISFAEETLKKLGITPLEKL